MQNPLLERRLRSVSRRLVDLRAEAAVADEHLAHFNDDADDARIRALVSETPVADADHRAAARSASAMARHRADLADTIARLELEQDELLDKLAARRRA
ncbi:MAG TPA: hypothetical protein VJM33_10505 [Microthrixaceae bacterium]|nr:hypothetical protein [Microthrixaceae bacterium]